MNSELEGRTVILAKPNKQLKEAEAVTALNQVSGVESAWILSAAGVIEDGYTIAILMRELHHDTIRSVILNEIKPLVTAFVLKPEATVSVVGETD